MSAIASLRRKWIVGLFVVACVSGLSLASRLSAQDGKPAPPPDETGAADLPKLKEMQAYLRKLEEKEMATDLQKLKEMVERIDPEPAEVQGPIPEAWEALIPKIDDIKPLPPFEIPDDPPPHEGAMIGMPRTLDPPDLIELEVLEGLPGRPITGEFLIQPDGTINLGFYGSVHVAGLTVDQAKAKIVLYMRRFLTDSGLGMIGAIAVEPPPPQPQGPGHLPRADKPPIEKGAGPDEKQERQAPPVEEPMPRPETNVPSPAVPKSSARRQASAPARSRLTRFSPQDKPPVPVPVEVRPGAGKTIKPVAPAKDIAWDRYILIQPQDSDRVSLRIRSFHSAVFYVTGAVPSPSCLPCTGRETVLDALFYSGLLDKTTADPHNIRLVRPARGKQPTRVYPIDLDAILSHGDPKANLQIFPGDRLVVGQNAGAMASERFDRATTPMRSLLRSITEYAMAIRTLEAGGSTVSGSGPIAPTDPAKGAERLRSFRDLLERSTPPGSLDAEEKALLDAMIRSLTPKPK